VAKSSLKLLLSFVEQNNSTRTAGAASEQLCRAIRIVDDSKGKLVDIFEELGVSVARPGQFPLSHLHSSRLAGALVLLYRVKFCALSLKGGCHLIVALW
jgi:hypothetical protein